MVNDVAPIEDDYGPAMMALTAKQRAAIIEVFENGGNWADAVRKAGYGLAQSTANTMSEIGRRLKHRPDVIKAMAEHFQHLIRTLGPRAMEGLRDVMEDHRHKDRLKAIGMVINRLDPEITRIDQNVRVEVVNHDEEQLAVLREFKRQGATQDFLEKWFGYTGLMKYEAMLANEAKVISGTVVENDDDDLSELLKE